MSVRCAVLAAFIGCLPTASLMGQDEKWVYDVQQHISYMRLTPQGKLLVGTDKRLLTLHPDSGTVVWERQGQYLIPAVDLGIGSLVLVIEGGGFRSPRARFTAAVDMETGKSVWQVPSVGESVMLGAVPLPGQKLVLISILDSGKTARRVMALDAETGALKWDKPDFTAIPHEVSPYWTITDSDTTAILLWGPEGLIKIDLRDGRRLWAAAVDATTKTRWRGVAPTVLLDGVVYAASEKTLLAFNPATGERLWANSPRLSGTVSSMQTTHAGLLLEGGFSPQRSGTEGKPFVAMLDPATGAVRWADSTLKSDLRGTSVAVGDSAVLVVAGWNLYSFDPRTGVRALEVRVKLKGLHTETLNGVEPRGRDILVSSNQNYLRLDAKGNVVFHSYFEPVGAAGWLVLLSAASTAITNAASQYNARMQANADPLGLPVRYKLVSDPVTNRWMKATELYRDHHFMFTMVEKNGKKSPALAQVSKQTGQIVRSVAIKEREPVYVFDEAAEIFFIIRGMKPKALAAYQLK